jgi:hypothetical protein
MATDISLILFDLATRSTSSGSLGAEIALLVQIGQGLPQDIKLKTPDVPTAAGGVHLNQIAAECENARDVVAAKGVDPKELVDLRDTYSGAMFNWVFQDSCTLAQIAAQVPGDKRLRVCTPYDSARLRCFPFELIEADTGLLHQLSWIPKAPLAVSAGWSVVRSIPMPFRDIAPGEIQELKVLVVGHENPTDVKMPPIDVQGEMHRLERVSRKIGTIKLLSLLNPTLDEIRKVVADEEIHCIHHIGHGCPCIPGRREPGLVFRRKDGKAQYVSCAQFVVAILGHGARGTARLVFLNACRTEGFSNELLRQGIPAVVATQFPVGDAAATVFAERFYATLASEGDIEAAVLSGRQALYLDASVQWATYALYLQASHGRLFKPHQWSQVEWVHIPAGPYRAGSERGRMEALIKKFGMDPKDNLDKVVEPIRSELVDEFWITRYPITNEQYAQMVQDWSYPANKACHPAVKISWQEAQTFAQWIGCDLPTIPQWEKAARGSQDLRCYPWGDEFDAQLCASAERNAGETEEVGQRLGGNSPYGVSDMVGNVMEWVKDTNRDGYAGSKGGAFDMTCEIYGLIHFTVWVEKTLGDNDQGFRLVTRTDPCHLPRGRHVVVGS